MWCDWVFVLLLHSARYINQRRLQPYTTPTVDVSSKLPSPRHCAALDTARTLACRGSCTQPRGGGGVRRAGCVFLQPSPRDSTRESFAASQRTSSSSSSASGKDSSPYSGASGDASASSQGTGTARAKSTPRKRRHSGEGSFFPEVRVSQTVVLLTRSEERPGGFDGMGGVRRGWHGALCVRWHGTRGPCAQAEATCRRPSSVSKRSSSVRSSDTIHSDESSSPDNGALDGLVTMQSRVCDRVPDTDS